MIANLRFLEGINMSEWKEYKLGDIVTFGNGKVRPNSKGNIPIYGGNGILGYCDKFNYSGETIIVGRVGAYCGSVYYENRPIWVSDNALALKTKYNYETKYVYYLLKKYNLNEYAEGSSHPLVTQTLLNSIEVIFTDNVEEQKRIASILSSLDDKIDLLHRENTTLEAMAETLFRQWFIEEAKEDWEEGKLGDFVSVIDNRGKTPPYTDNITEYPIIEVNALTGAERYVKYNLVKKYVEKEIYDSWFRGYFHKYDIFVSTVGSIGELAMCLEERGVIAQNVVALHANNISPFYLYQYLMYNKDDLKGLDIGSVQPSIKVPHLLNIPVVIPSKDVLLKYDNYMVNVVEKLLYNVSQIKIISQLRDNLLYKLISNEISL